MDGDLTQSRPDQFSGDARTAAMARLPDPSSLGVSFTLQGPVLVQIVDILNISASRSALLDSLQEKDDNDRVRKIIRTVDDSDLNGTNESSATNGTNGSNGSNGSNGANGASGGVIKKGTHSITVQDAKGTLMRAIEVSDLSWLSMDTPLGSKVIVKDCPANHGVLMLKPQHCRFLGGNLNIDNRKVFVNRLKDQLDQIKRLNS
uniref:RecQ-mediated genome instability protein 1 n=1 Tax=Blastobotrys adeninivorans TaxID=409370 RepID=A0A060T607_BLAAD